MNALGYIDLRSDTITQPTPEMREAMYHAVVGDDVYYDDPTTTELEREGARILGKEAALYVPSGTMSNQLGVLCHTRPGDEIILGEKSHIFEHEVGAAAVLAGVSMRALRYPGTMPDPDMIRAAIRPDDIHEPATALICMENALANGQVVPLDIMRQVYSLAGEHGLPVHLDGARIFNAAASLGVDVGEITRYCDTVNCCLSKALCAPVGSLFAGSDQIVKQARRWRKLLGGGMRQTGFMAAAGLVALREMPKRLLADHANALYLADKLASLDGVKVMADRLDINMVYFTIQRPERLLAHLPDKLQEKRIRICPRTVDGEWRWVTHNDIERTDIDTAVACLAEMIG